MGYLGREEETKKVFDAEGFFHTGDRGFIDEEGYLKLTGRSKELIITSGGENIAPSQIELLLCQECKILSHVMVVGEYRKYLSALLTIKVTVDRLTNKPTEHPDP
jgi:long-subunit acyl-CoA synthetase (AMP-forming)